MPIYLVSLLISYKKGKSTLRREVEIVTKGENVGELNRRPTTVQRVKDAVYGNAKQGDVLILKIIDKKLIGYGIQD